MKLTSRSSEQNHPTSEVLTILHFIDAEELLRETYANDVNNQISFEDAHGLLHKMKLMKLMK